MLLQGTAVDIVAPSDADSIAEVLRRRITAYQRGERPTRLDNVSQFSRRVQANRLMDAVATRILARQTAGEGGEAHQGVQVSIPSVAP